MTVYCATCGIEFQIDDHEYETIAPLIDAGVAEIQCNRCLKDAGLDPDTAEWWTP